MLEVFLFIVPAFDNWLLVPSIAQICPSGDITVISLVDKSQITQDDHQSSESIPFLTNARIIGMNRLASQQRGTSLMTHPLRGQVVTVTMVVVVNPHIQQSALIGRNPCFSRRCFRLGLCLAVKRNLLRRLY
jgi:hypothetical protein